MVLSILRRIRGSTALCSNMSKWDMFPYVSGGKELAKKPLRMQILVFGALGMFWIVTGIVSNQTWFLGVGVVLLAAPFIGSLRRRRSRGQQ